MNIDLGSDRHATPLEENGKHSYQYVKNRRYTYNVIIYRQKLLYVLKVHNSLEQSSFWEADNS